MNDDRLRQAFTELRRQEAARAPRLDQLLKAAASRRTPKAFAFAAILLIVLLLSFLPFVHKRPQPSIEAWKAPTDFLLVTPGRELLESTPDLRGTHP